MYLFKLVFSFLQKNTRSGIAGWYGSSIFNFLRRLCTVFQWLHQSTFPLTVYKASIFPASTPVLVICFLLDDVRSITREVLSHCGFDVHFPDDCDIERLLTWLLAICISSLGKCPFINRSSAHFWIGLFGLFLCLLILHCLSSLYTLDINPLLDIWLANVFPRLSLTLSMVPFAAEEAF